MLSNVKLNATITVTFVSVLLCLGCQKKIEGTEEICNHEDDDWDGLTDEPFTDKQGNYNQVEHCGDCGIECQKLFPSAKKVACESVDGDFKCKILSCPEGTHITNETFCAPDGDISCLPCMGDIDCQFRDPNTACRTLITGSKRCLLRCDLASPHCPPGYECGDDGSEDLCYPSSGFCGCTDVDGEADGGISFGCLIDNPQGTHACEGSRECLDGGLTDCEPLYDEICDGEDNDCDGFTDETFMVGNLYLDSEHCGACNHPCVPIAPNTKAECVVESETPTCVRDCEKGYVDLDGAEINGCECAMQEAIWPPQVLGKDQNCDGVDDDTTPFVFVSKKGHDTNSGNMKSPVLTIGRGIELASPLGKTVLVAQGNYDEQVRLKPGVSLFGGYRTDFGQRDTTLFEVIISHTGGVAGHPVLIAKNISVPAEMKGFTLQGSDATAKGAGSTAVFLSRCTKALRLENMKILAGAGRRGENGKTSIEILSSNYDGTKPADLDGVYGSKGAPGFNSNTRRCRSQEGQGGNGGKKICPTTKIEISGGNGGDASCPDTGCTIGFPCANAGCTNFMIGNACDFESVTKLARPNPPAEDGKGPNGGKRGALTYDAPTTRPGSNFCDDNPTLLREGDNGEPGQTGTDGEGGDGCINFNGEFSRIAGIWSGTAGTHGISGSDGGGGGGGTQGNGYDVLFGAAWDYDDHLGGAGGGGGSGGCGAPGAQAGGGGGSSIGVAILLGDGQGPTLVNLRVVPNRAGDGGFGGIGASGGAPGTGGQGGDGNFWCARKGGTGGDGGKGGHGGGGGGGCGGSISGFHVIPDENHDGVEYIKLLEQSNFVNAVPSPGSGGQGGFSPGEPGTTGMAGTARSFRLVGADTRY